MNLVDIFLATVRYFYYRQTTVVKTNTLKMGVAQVMVNVIDRESALTGI